MCEFIGDLIMTKTLKPPKARLSDSWKAVRNLEKIYGSKEVMKRDFPPIFRLYQKYKREIEQLKKHRGES